MNILFVIIVLGLSIENSRGLSNGIIMGLSAGIILRSNPFHGFIHIIDLVF